MEHNSLMPRDASHRSPGPALPTVIRLAGVTLAAWVVAWFLSGGLRSAFASPKAAAKFELQTTAFQTGQDIPPRFTCDGADVSPPLRWTEPPAGTGSFALIADDPDAPGGTWVHWLAYDLPATLRELPEGAAKSQEFAGGARQGSNDFERIGYGGPCPPPGKAHRYFFKLYGLDKKLDLKAGATKQDLERAMKGHILVQAELMGRYHR